MHRHRFRVARGSAAQRARVGSDAGSGGASGTGTYARGGAAMGNAGEDTLRSGFDVLSFTRTRMKGRLIPWLLPVHEASRLFAIMMQCVRDSRKAVPEHTSGCKMR